MTWVVCTLPGAFCNFSPKCETLPATAFKNGPTRTHKQAWITALCPCMRMPAVPGRRRGFRAGFPEASRAFPTARAARGHLHPPRPAPRVTSRRALTSHGNGGAQERTRGAAAVAAGRAGPCSPLSPLSLSVLLCPSLSLSVPWLLSAVSAGQGGAGRGEQEPGAPARGGGGRARCSRARQGRERGAGCADLSSILLLYPLVFQEGCSRPVVFSCFIVY